MPLSSTQRLADELPETHRCDYCLRDFDDRLEVQFRLPDGMACEECYEDARAEMAERLRGRHAYR
jgi:hypothetical protein